MTFSKKLLCAGLLSGFMTTAVALADTLAPLSTFAVSGNNTYTGSTVTFGTAQLGAADDTGTTMITGTFANYLTDGTGGSQIIFNSPLSYALGQNTLAAAVPVFSVSGTGGEVFTFSVQSYNATLTTSPFEPTSSTLLLYATGFFTGTGLVNYSASPATYLLSSQIVDGHAQTTFSGSTTVSGTTPVPEVVPSGVTPEPNSFALLATGLVAAAGAAMLQTRRRAAVKI